MVEPREDFIGRVIPIVPAESRSCPPSEHVQADKNERARSVLRKLLTSQSTNEEVLEVIQRSILHDNEQSDI